MFELHAKSKTTAEILMYGSIGEWSRVRAEDIYKNLQAAKSQGYEKVKLRVNCPGGSIFEGIAIISAIQNSGVDVSLSIDGMAASMGAAIIAAIEDVEMAEGARIMIHQGSGVSIGQSWQMRMDADLLDSLNRTLSEYFATKTGKDKQWILDNWMAAGKDKWFTAQEAVDAKLVKRKIPGKAKPLQKEEATFYEMAAHYDQYFNTDKTENKMDKNKLIALLGLKADATDAEIEVAISANKLKAEATPVAAAPAAPAASAPAPAAPTAATPNDKQIVVDGIIALAKERGMSEEKVASLKILAGIDAKAAMELIPKASEATQPSEKNPLSVNELIAAIKGEGKGNGPVDAKDQSTWDFNEWSKHPKEFSALLEKNPAKYQKIFEAQFGYEPTLDELKGVVFKR